MKGIYYVNEGGIQVDMQSGVFNEIRKGIGNIKPGQLLVIEMENAGEEKNESDSKETQA